MKKYKWEVINCPETGWYIQKLVYMCLPEIIECKSEKDAIKLADKLNKKELK